jgi:hypothetical protein
MRAIKVMTLMTLAVVVISAGVGLGQVIPTSEWTPFGSSVSTINNELLPVGTLVTAFDQSGVMCGIDTVDIAGLYKMSVYGDDLYSPAVDEGCTLGEAIVFKINGVVADKLGPSDGLWSGKGPIKQEDLAIVQDFGVRLSGQDEGLGYAGKTTDYSVYVNNTGTGMDRFILDATSGKGWNVTNDADPAGFYVAAGDSVEVVVSVDVPLGATVGEQDELTVLVVSQFDGSNSDSKLITTTVDELTSVDENNYAIPGQFRLHQNFPNPFNPETAISFNLEKSTQVRLEVFDILGRKQVTLFAGLLSAGEHSFVWQGTDASGRPAASGIYFYRLSSSEYSITRKMALLK